MSHYDWERGSFKLPSAEFASMRQALQAADDKVKRAAFEQTQTFWKQLTRKQQTDPNAYQQALHEWTDDNVDAGTVTVGQIMRGRYSSDSPRQDAFQKAVRDLAYDRLDRVRGGYRGKPPRRVQVADMEYPTNRSTVFYGDGCSISFDRAKSTVTWEVGQNNHAVETARDSHLGRLFFQQLDEVKWTRGTGGVITGNNEVNEEGGGSGGGSNYVAGGWGPVGAQQAPFHTPPWTDPQGVRHQVDASYDRFGRAKGTVTKTGPGGPGRVAAGTSRGGQFTSRGYGDPGQLRF